MSLLRLPLQATLLYGVTILMPKPYNLGFISAYARANNIEDFAEMTAHDAHNGQNCLGY